MKLIRSVDILNDKKSILRLNIVSIFLLVLFFLLFLAVTAIIPVKESSITFSVMQLLLVTAGTFLLIVIHELIHGVFFRVFSPKGKVKFGINIKKGIAYAASPGSKYSRGQFAWISLAPFVLITLSLTIAYLSGILFVGSYLFLATFHAAACAGDFYWICLVLQAPKGSLVEDTEVGINFYH
ncbi:DUF3267 domain-containing protein [Enterococcus sp. AZ163]|uniref:DUF3267 domain-containing protein n=1 Tax=Enterococcus sp. AZ163 TaxID=2774638 RepID=UPI003D2A64C8